MANILTAVRIACGLLIAVSPAFSGWYYSFYLLGGFTDAIDGAVARRQDKATSFGAKFDTVADIIFALAVVIKLICNLAIPAWLILWIIFIALLKIVNVLVGFAKYHRLITVHSNFNKLTGIILFLPPLFVGGNYAWQAKAIAVIIACIFASVAAMHEFIFVWNGRNIE